MNHRCLNLFVKLKTSSKRRTKRFVWFVGHAHSMLGQSTHAVRLQARTSTFFRRAPSQYGSWRIPGTCQASAESFLVIYLFVNTADFMQPKCSKETYRPQSCRVMPSFLSSGLEDEVGDGDGDEGAWRARPGDALEYFESLIVWKRKRTFM